jgi:HSP20 family protein
MASERGAESGCETPSLRTPGREVEYVTPAVDIYETETGHVLLADLPGVDRDGLEIHVERDQLVLRGRVRHENGPKRQHEEFRLRDYYRVFTLADEIDTEHITAALVEGVLRLELPKSGRARVRKVPIH